VQSITHQDANGATFDGNSYTYDPAGNVTSNTSFLNGTTSAYSYDNDYQVTQVMQNGAVSENYTYDAVGNRLTDKDSGYTYNLSNQLLSKTGTAFTYDNNGNMLTKTGANGTTQYSWDFENRLVQVVAPNADGTSSTISFQYDPFGRRIQKVGPNGTLNYIYDGANVRAQLDGNGFVITDYITGLGVDELLEAIPPGDNFYYETDRLGSVTSVSDAFVPATVLDTDTYTSFGATTDQNLSAGNPFRYTGREQDDETGLYYYRARYYDPTVGRFLSEDPVQFNGGVNFYAYVLNNPTRLVDPSGLCGQMGQQQITCDTVLPDGRTIGDVVRQQRAVLQGIVDSTIRADQFGADSDPVSALSGQLLSIAWPNGPIDFKNNFKGEGDAKFLGQAGNFAFYAIGSGYLPNWELDAGASAYSVLSATFGRKPFSSLTRPGLIDASAAAVRGAALAANGCEQ